jgi:hypothetical protein
LAQSRSSIVTTRLYPTKAVVEDYHGTMRVSNSSVGFLFTSIVPEYIKVREIATRERSKRDIRLPSSTIVEWSQMSVKCLVATVVALEPCYCLVINAPSIEVLK